MKVIIILEEKTEDLLDFAKSCDRKMGRRNNLNIWGLKGYISICHLLMFNLLSFTLIQNFKFTERKKNKVLHIKNYILYAQATLLTTHI